VSCHLVNRNIFGDFDYNVYRRQQSECISIVVYSLFSSVTNLSVYIHDELLSNPCPGSTHTAVGHSHWDRYNLFRRIRHYGCRYAEPSDFPSLFIIHTCKCNFPGKYLNEKCIVSKPYRCFCLNFYAFDFKRTNL
jgi:hypothetical protein